MNGNLTYGNEINLSLDSIENERQLLSLLSAKRTEINNLKTAVTSFSERKEIVDTYESKLDDARSDYNRILNKLNLIRMRNKSSNLHQLKEESKEKQDVQIEKKDTQFDYNNKINGAYTGDNTLNNKISVLDTVIY